ncbi:MAG TPA: 23S rRNA pseudouridine(1911/1915/1917) synthase RluD [Gammaproteobacteria bacterium]|jgi:23S rRNA pseudouridine1911/1915/1917 synthase|nr:23S rRNA pseudouridine(1911/1915/1917) synthase RluD [Gammaproteobacteria bacterium]
MSRIQRRLTVPDDLGGKRLDQAAALLLPEFSRSRLKSWIDAGQLTVGGEAAKPRLLLQGGEQLVLDTELESAVPVAPEAIPVKVVHADDALLVIDKPVGLVVHPGAGNPSGTLQNALLNLYPGLALLPRAGLVHRLDKDTSGLLLVARTLASQTALAAALERREIKRTYRAICQGVLTGGGTVDAPIGRHRRERTKMAVVDGGRPARTHYRVVERFRAHTHVEVELETGRTHQIRVHMAHIRAPLLGDPVYGGRPRLPSAPSDELRLALQGFRRQALHASRLAFAHPVTGEPLTFESPLPPDMERLLALLRADAAAAR